TKIRRIFGRTPPSEPEPAPSAGDSLTRRLAGVNIQDLLPPCEVHASEPWDRYWRLQHETGVWAFNEMFVDDRDLLRVIRAREFQPVFCVGSGLALEPHALAALGLCVTMLDISREVVGLMGAAVFDANAFGRILDRSELQAGGNLECVAGDLTDPSLCPGP